MNRISLHVLDPATVTKLLARRDSKTKPSADIAFYLEQKKLPPSHKITYDKRHLQLLDELEGDS